MSRKSAMQRFDEKVCRLSCGCWLWCATTDLGGYGRIKVNGRLEMAHRFAYKQAKGPIGEGLEIDHLCRNRSCVNPDHLEAVTHHVNVLRGGNAIKTHCKHGHEYTPRNTLRMASGSRFCRLCRNAVVRNRRRRIRQART